MVTRTPASAPWPPPVGIRHREAPDRAVAEVRGVLDSIGDACPECPPAIDQAASSMLEADKSRPASSSHAIAKPIRRCRSGPWATRQALWPPPLRAEDRSLSIERKRNRRSYTITLHRNTVWSLSARVVRESRGRAKPPVLSPALAACDDG
jgi:hypothetical protein